MAGLTGAAGILFTVDLLTQSEPAGVAGARRQTGPPNSMAARKELNSRAPHDPAPAIVNRSEGAGAGISITTLDGGYGALETVAAHGDAVQTSGQDAPGKPVGDNATLTVSEAERWGFRHVAAPQLPVVLQEPPAGAVFLTPDEASGAEHIQEQFITESGSGLSDSSTPAYLKNWGQAQSVADQRLRAAIGAQAFSRWQMEAYLSTKKAP
jgi:hypothetical protein